MENQVKIFSNLTNKNEKFAKKYLRRFNWNLEFAIEYFFQNGGEEMKEEKKENQPKDKNLFEAIMKNDMKTIQDKITNNYEEIVNYKEEDGSNLLHQATQNSKLDMIRLLIESGIKINSQNKKGKSPLHIAVAGNMYDIIELFIENKADIDIQDKSGCTPLFIAVEFGFYKIAELLLKNNANFHLFSKKLLPIHLAARNNNSSLVELLLNHGADPNTISQEGKTAYHYTHSIFVQKILRSKMNPLNFPNYHLLKDIEIINEDISFLSSIISSKFSGLDLDKIGKFFRLALSNRYLGQIKSILQKFHFQNYRDQYENSLLYYAILENNNLLVKLILENGGNPNIIGAENKSPLHIAAELGNVPAILLLLKYDANLSAKDSEKRKPIDCARNQVSNFILSHFQQKIILKTRKKSNKDIFNDLVSEFSIFINCWIDMNKIQVLHQIGKGINGKSYLGKWESKDVVIKIVEDLSQPNLALEQKYYNEQMEKNVKIRQKSNVEENINSFFDSKRNFSGKHFFGTFYGYFIDHEENGKAHFVAIRKYYPQGSIRDWMDRMQAQNTKFDRTTLLNILQKTAAAISLLHSEKDLLLLTLKPENVMLTSKSSQFKIVDMFMLPKEPFTKGFPHIMSIHFHQGSDVHSFGLFVWELMTFKQPYKNINDPNGSKYNNDEMIQIFEKSISCYSSLLQFVIRKFFYVCFINGSTRDMEYISELLAMLETQFLSVSENENVNVNVSQKTKNVQMIQSKETAISLIAKEMIQKLQTFENQRFSINQIEMILKEFFFKSDFCFPSKFERDEDQIFLSIQSILETLHWLPTAYKFDSSVKNVDISNLIEAFKASLDLD